MKAWEGVLTAPVCGRAAKPRSTGTTFASVKGVGRNALRDMISLAGGYVDRVKLSFGHTLLIDEDVLREKIELLRAADIDVNPGGTCGEIALFQGPYRRFLSRAAELGFNTIEVSDGTIRMNDSTRERCIKEALEAGFQVVSEVGKKDPAENLLTEEMVRQIKRDIDYGASRVVIESREGAKGFGVFDAQGEVKAGEVDRIATEIEADRLIWEAPRRSGQLYFIEKFGPNVNLGNISPDDLIPLEALRQGLRGDTFRGVVRTNARRQGAGAE